MDRSALAVAATLLLVTAGCASEDDPGSAPTTSSATAGMADGGGATSSPGAAPAAGTTGHGGEGTTAPASGETGAGPSAYGLALLATPAGATHLTVTDLDAVRERLGVPELTSQDLMTDRLEFWRAAEASTVLLTDGLLREENSRYDLTYDFTQDDVDAEVRWRGPDGAGFLLAMRPDLDPDLVQAAIDDGAPGLGGAVLDRATSTVLGGATTGEVWASDPALAVVGDVPAESLVVRDGCVPFATALGVDATVEHQDEVLAAHDVASLTGLEAVAVAFTGRTATVRLAYPSGTSPATIETDLAARVALGEDWPTTESVGFADGFGEGSVAGVSGTVGELRYAVTNPGAAAHLVLADLVPLGVCPEVELLEEPTGL
ncbi:hypothetical protein [Ornithinimicrobium cavernae]|uniref:hypothetical protein n=1 Tax=Ornithinimicrobium cavernae TaxID=2666047 RepID=UPI000D6A016B|nr:hypothetical protein [Ornithinimicrobium cavernae]